MSSSLDSNNTGASSSLKRGRETENIQTTFSFDFNPAPPSAPFPPALANRRESYIKPPSSSALANRRETFAFSTAPPSSSASASAFAAAAPAAALAARRESMLPAPSSTSSSSLTTKGVPPMRKLTAPPTAMPADPHLGPAQKKQRTATGAAAVSRPVAPVSRVGSAATTATRAAVNPPGVTRRTSSVVGASSGYGVSGSAVGRVSGGLGRSSSAPMRRTTAASSSSTATARPATTAANLASVPEDGALHMDESMMRAMSDRIVSQLASDRAQQMADIQAQLLEVQRSAQANQDKYFKAVDENVEMKGRVAQMEAQLKIAESDRDRLQRDLDARAADLADTRAHLARLDADHRELQAVHADQLRHQEAERQQEIAGLRIQVQQLATERDALAGRVTALEADIAQARAALSAVSARELDLSTAHGTLRENYAQVTAHLTATSETLAERDARVRELEAKVRDMESERRRLHNEIQELKGNIRVFLRVRPVLEREAAKAAAAAAPEHLRLDDKNNAIEYVQRRNTADGRVVVEPLKYKFDKVFTPSASQAHVFEEISHLVQSALDGYNVCILAYGQTGSGKTYTMEGRGMPRAGSDADDIGDPYANDERGMIPRAVDQIFLTARGLREQGWTYEFCGQYVEIYNETVRDLLADSTSSAAVQASARTAGGAAGAGRGSAFGPGRGAAATAAADANKLDVVTDPVTQMPHVPGATKRPLTTPSEVHAMLALAARNRSVAATAMNDRSSRSHSVFILFLRGSNALTGEACEAQMFLVDLAGSERIAKSGAANDQARLKEATNINKSLTALGDVIEQLIRRGDKMDKAGGGGGGADDDAYVGFRSSKLTHLLKSGLGGNSKALMFVNVSPLAESSAETKNSLTFASRVNGCQIGTARKNVQRSSGK